MLLLLLLLLQVVQLLLLLLTVLLLEVVVVRGGQAQRMLGTKASERGRRGVERVTAADERLRVKGRLVGAGRPVVSAPNLTHLIASILHQGLKHVQYEVKINNVTKLKQSKSVFCNDWCRQIYVQGDKSIMPI